MTHHFFIYSPQSTNCRCIGDKQQYFLLLPWAADFPSVFTLKQMQKSIFFQKFLKSILFQNGSVKRRGEISCKRGNAYFLHLETRFVDHPVPVFNIYKLNINMQYYKTVVLIQTVLWTKNKKSHKTHLSYCSMVSPCLQNSHNSKYIYLYLSGSRVFCDFALQMANRSTENKITCSVCSRTDNDASESQGQLATVPDKPGGHWVVSQSREHFGFLQCPLTYHLTRNHVYP